MRSSEYKRRVSAVHELIQHYPGIWRSIARRERSVLEKFYLGALFAPDAELYRCELLSADPLIEIAASRAYQHLIEQVGLPAHLQGKLF